jgi:parallel beta-helix repeat protein
MALVNFSFAYPAIEDNTFVDNKMAIRNDQYGSPLVKHNLFRGNDTAIYNYRKSNPVVENNRIEKSGLALYCDYSSYPKVKNNNFIDNKMAVELGIFQSADWEKRSGSKPLMQKEAAARNSKNTMLRQAPTRFSDIVDVSGNWWGDAGTKMAGADDGENLPFFHDRLDKEWVTYEGFGPDRYRIDLVVYKPLLSKPVAAVGPRKKK